MPEEATTGRRRLSDINLVVLGPIYLKSEYPSRETHNTFELWIIDLGCLGALLFLRYVPSYM